MGKTKPGCCSVVPGAGICCGAAGICGCAGIPCHVAGTCIPILQEKKGNFNKDSIKKTGISTKIQ